jgi:hypothetical protein
MSDSLIKTIKLISSAHSKFHTSIKSFVIAVSNPDLFPKTAVAVVLISTVVGVGCMQVTEKQRKVRWFLCFFLRPNDGVLFGKFEITLIRNYSC